MKKIKIAATTFLFITSLTLHSSCFMELCKSKDISPPVNRTIVSILETLKADSCEEAYEILSTVKTLDLSYTNIYDLTPLTEFIQLENLFLAGAAFTDITPIQGLFNLKVLDISENDLSLLQNLSALKYMGRLEKLFIKDSELATIEGISKLTSLRYLNAGYNYLIDISEMKSLSNLEYVSLMYNEIEDVSPLAFLAKLDTAYLLRNSIIKDIDHCPTGEDVAPPIDLFCSTYINN